MNASSTVVTLGSPGVYPAYATVAVDSSGNVYVGDYNNHLVYELPFAAPPSLNFATATAVGTTDTTDGPKSVTVANKGNADLTFPIPSTSGATNPSISPNFALDGSGSCPQLGSGAFSAGTPSAGSTCTLLVNFTPTASGSINGSLVLTDTNLNANPSSTQTILLSGTGGNAGVPGAPTNVTATAGNGRAFVNFAAPASDGGSAIKGYSVVSSPGGLTLSCTASPCTVTGLTNGTTYTFTVAATNSVGTSAPSAASNAVTPIASQTITFNNPGAQIFGTSPTLTATASSGLAVTFSSSTPQICTITSGGQLTFVTVGTCTINANQAGNAAYAPALQVPQSFTITHATASITLGNLSVTYDGTAHTVTAATTPSSLAVSTTYNGSSAPPTAAGTYSVTATINDSNYSGSTTGTLIINKAMASVMPNAASKSYGTSDPALTGTLNGFVASDSVTASYTRTVGETVASSPYIISAALSPVGVLTNYNIAYNTAPFTINKATPVVSLAASTGFQIQSNPVTFSVTVAAVTGGSAPTGSITFYDASTVLGTTLLASGTASYTTSSLGIGSHSITATYSGDSNYAAVTSSSSVSETIGILSITSTGSGASVEVSPGGQAVFTLAFAPPSGLTFPQTIQLSLSGLPSGAAATFSPNSIPAGSGTTNVTLTISVPTTASVTPLNDPFRNQPLPIALGLVLLPFAFKLRKAAGKLQRGNHALLMIVAAIVITTSLSMGLSGCGGSSNSGSSGGNTTPRTYPLTLTATSGTYTQTATLTLVVK